MLSPILLETNRAYVGSALAYTVPMMVVSEASIAASDLGQYRPVLGHGFWSQRQSTPTKVYDAML